MKLHVFFAFLFCIAAVAAELEINVVKHDSDMQSTYSELKVCSCGSAVDELRVKNIGALEAGYSFSIEADQPWFTLEKNWVYLQPGETTDIAVFTNAPCGVTAPGTYKVFVASEYGRYRAMEKTIETGVCENTWATMTPLDALVQPCAAQRYTLNITNVGTFREHYTVEGLGFPQVTLDPDESASLDGWYQASCEEYGEKIVPVTVYANNNDRSQVFDARITVPRAYDYTIALGQMNQPVCAGVQSIVPVTITNNEDRANTITLSGEPWSNATSVYVGANRNRTVALSFTPKRAGEREFTVSAESRNGSIEKEATMTVPVEACYGYTIEAPARVNSCPGELYIPFVITSEGYQQQQLSLDIESNATSSIDSLSVTLNPSQVITKTVTMNVADADRAYYLTLNATSNYYRDQATVAVRGYSTESCYNVFVQNTHLRVWTDQTMVPIIVEHNGIQPATYTISYNGTISAPAEQSITLAPGGMAVIHLLVNSTDYETGRYVERLTLSANGVDYTSDLELKLRAKGFWQQFLDACRWNGEFGVCSVTSTLSFIIMILVVLAVLGVMIGLVHYENPANYSKQTAGMLGGALLVLLLVAMIVSAPAIPRAYERDIAQGNDTALTYEVGAGQIIALNISQLFIDPDNDTLSYTASQSEHLVVRIENGMAQIKANENFRGQETLVFTANDRNGGITDSGLVTITVVPFKPVSFLAYWQYACWFLTFLFFFIAVTLALLTTLFIKDVQAEHESKKAVVLYRKPRTTIIRKSQAQELVETADTRIRNIPAGTTVTHVGQVIGTQINNDRGEQLYVASQEGTKFHRITCPVVKGMPKDNRLTFSSKEDAIKAGYTPCKTCSSHD